METEQLLAWGQIILSGATTVILVPLAVYFALYYWERRRWRTFEILIRNWAREEEIFLDDLTDGDWNALVAMKLSEAGFEPSKIKELMELAVSFAQGRASLEVKGKIRT